MGVNFELRKEGSEEVFTGTTDENGEIIFENLEPGNYSLIETETKEEYKLDENPLFIEVKYNEETEITVKNDLKKGSFRIIKQDMENATLTINIPPTINKMISH